MHNIAGSGPSISLSQIRPPVQGELEMFSAAVEKIYDAVLDHSQWNQALGHILKVVGASQAAIHFGDVSNQQASFGYHVGFTPEFMAGIEEYAFVWAAESGMPMWEVGKVYHLPDIVPLEQHKNGRFYREHLSKHNQGDYMGALALKEGARFAPVTISTFAHEGPIPARGVELMRLLTPHLCRAAKISAAMDLKTLKSDSLEQSLNALTASVFLLNAAGHVVHMNEAARSLEKHGRNLKVVSNRLTVKDAGANNALTSAISSLSGAQALSVPNRISVALPHPENGLIATVLPLGNGDRTLLAKPFAAVTAVFVQEPANVPPVPGEAFARLYGFTPSEIRVVMTMLSGLNVQDVADILGVGEATVRSHLKAMFTKTGTTRQSELLQLLSRSTPPVA